MRTYIVKYEDHRGNCHCDEVRAHSSAHAITMLTHDVATIYWCKIKPS
jgi:hypothetical protein